MSACGGCRVCGPADPAAAKPASAGEVEILPLVPHGDAPIDKATSERQGDFSPPYRYPFLLGFYLGINAIPDAAGIVDGPDCLFFKAEGVHGKHDVNSTLLSVDGRHRILVSHVYTDNLVTEQGDRVRDHVLALRDAGARAAFVSSLPMVTIIGTQYDKILRDAQVPGIDLIDVPGRSLQADWMAGYTDLLEAMARTMALPPGPTRAEAVALVGYLYERNEEDHLANTRELRRLVEGLGLELVTVWLGGEPVDTLSEVAAARTLLALPMGRKTARLLAERTGANVVEVDLPFGLGKTARFLRALGRATGRVDRAEAFIEAELRAAVPRLEWIVPHTFLGKRVAFSGAPDRMPGFVQLATDLGLEVVHLSSPTRRPSWLGDLAEYGPLPPMFFDVSHHQLRKELLRIAVSDGDLLVAPGTLIRRLPERLATVEFGFPSYTHHALFDEPDLGYRGFLCFAQRMANALEGRNRFLRGADSPGAIAAP